MFYIDEKYKCHASNPDGAYLVIDKDSFKGKCNIFIEGYQFIPDGEEWISNDGDIIHGEMMTPWMDYDKLDAAQREYEKQQLNEYKEFLIELGVEI